ncbi:acetyltransferase [Robiginitalea sp. SC105]|uniref:acetyltransferase n=1 Tax=Robiginitalea sp. SC105 TaxID=2762332 RepID=UPI001639F907|nr:acetyltransferase [Robiginitalea sp. SC105]MBC2837734.1 acetyltransferase [Robiginitalea sp. SC105]
MNNILIFGASGHGSVVLDIIESQGQYKPIGFLDTYKRKGPKKNGYEILGNTKDLPYLIEKFNIYGGIVAIGDNWIRQAMVNRIKKVIPEFRFVSAVHPTANIGKDVRIGNGSVIMPGVIVNANSVIGRHCILNTLSSLGHDGQMADFSSLAPRVGVGGNFQLGYCSAISIGTNVIENVSIEMHTVVGAGSLVINDIPGYKVAYGSPAKIIRNREIGESYLALNRSQVKRTVPDEL